MWGKTYEGRIKAVEEEIKDIEGGIERDVAGLVNRIGILNEAGMKLRDVLRNAYDGKRSD